jgi:PKD repeat protein
VYNILGSYDVTLTVTNNAGQRKKYKPLYIQVGPSGIAGPGARTGFTVSPNPAHEGRVTLTFASASAREIIIFSSLGARLNFISTGEKILEINQPELTEGLYFIQVKDVETGITNTRKLIIQ